MRVRPESLELGDATVSADLARAPEQGWLATVLLVRGPGSPRIAASDVDVQLIDAAGTELAVLERPTGELVEAGGSLGTTANATFRFGSSAAVPAELIVRLWDATGRF